MIVRGRWIPFVLVLALVFAACSSRTKAQGTGTGASGSPTAGTTSTVSPGAKGGSGGSSTGASSTPGGTGAAGQSYRDGGSVGEMARAYLRRSPATELRVEVDWVTGREPSSSTLDHLRSVLLSVADKPEGIIVEKDQALPAGPDQWRLADIVSLERTARQRHSSGNTATMWIVYLNGSFGESDGTLGLAYTASSAAIFRDRMDDATTALLLESEIERSVITHEAGHLLALVNIGYHSRINHEDPQHPHHSSSQNSVMYWQIEDVSIRSLLNGGPPADFDDSDRADLKMLREGG